MVGIKGRKPDQPMNAVLRFQVAGSIVAIDPDDGALYPCLLPRGNI